MFPSLRRTVFILFVCLWSFGTSDPAAAVCRGVVVDRVWSGASVGFAAISTRDHVFAGYYDASRRLTLARIATADCSVERVALDEVFEGWDSHNGIEMFLDSDGRLHVAANMHNVPLVYFRSELPLDIRSVRRARMTGLFEDKVTYPRFMGRADGSTVFLYRHGRSGNGVWYVNVTEGPVWRKLGSGPVFASSADESARFDPRAQGTYNAYPSSPVRGPDGSFHFAVIWRKTPDVASNFGLSFVKTTDFETWTTATGRKLTLPIRPAGIAAIDDAGERAGLATTGVSIDPEGRAVVAYGKHVDGTNGIFVTRPDAGPGRSVLVAKARVPAPVEGRGTLLLPSHGPVVFRSGEAVIDVRFVRETPRRIRLDPVTLRPLGEGPVPPVQDGTSPLPENPDLARNLIRSASVKTMPGGPRISLRWRNQGVNADRPRSCTPETPRACDPAPSPLVLDIF